MIKRVVKIKTLKDNEIKDNLEYWLSKSPEERLSAVEHLWRQRHGDKVRFKKVIRVRKLSGT